MFLQPACQHQSPCKVHLYSLADAMKAYIRPVPAPLSQHAGNLKTKQASACAIDQPTCRECNERTTSSTWSI